MNLDLKFSTGNGARFDARWGPTPTAVFFVLFFWFIVFLTTFPFENAFLASPKVLNLDHCQHVLLTSFQVRILSDFAYVSTMLLGPRPLQRRYVEYLGCYHVARNPVASAFLSTPAAMLSNTATIFAI